MRAATTIGRAINVIGRPRMSTMAASLSRAVVFGYMPAEFGAVAHWRADLGVHLTSGLIDTSLDQAGANIATQANPANQPLLLVDAKNGRPAVKAVDATDQLALAGLTLTAADTFFLVAAPSSTAGDLFANGAGTTAIISGFGPGTFEWFNNPDRQVLSVAGTGSRVMVVTQTDGVNLSGYFDNPTPAVFSVAPTVALSGTIILFILAGVVDALIEELAIFPSALSATARTQLMLSAKAKYALP